MDVLALLAQAAKAGLSVRIREDQVVISGPRSASSLAAEIGRHRAAVLAHLRSHIPADTDTTRNSPGDAGVVSADPTQNWLTRNHVGLGRVVLFDPQAHDGNPVDWQEQPVAPEAEQGSLGWLGDWALLLDEDDLSDDLTLHPGQTIVHRARYLAWLRADVRRGVDGPRARTGGLQAELQELWDALLGGSSDP